RECRAQFHIHDTPPAITSHLSLHDALPIYLDGVATLKMRLLGDRVSRAVAWRVARELDAPDTAVAEYVAVAMLQADVLVAGDAGVAAAAEGRVPLVAYEDLLR